MSKIIQLSDNVISQIAAGEVVEKPVSVVKELVENSLDSGSNKIIIELEDGGKNLIRVIDNGEGMDKSNLIMSIKNHTTSKCISLDNNITTYGFRGEALASIASISELILISKTKQSKYAYKLFNNIVDIDLSLNEHGSIVEVYNLFWKTPVRLKFLQSNSIELSRIVKYIKNVAMSAFNVHFTLLNNGKKIYEYKSVNSTRERIFNILNCNSDDFYEIDTQLDDGYSIKGFIVKNHVNYRNRDHIYFFVNGRIVKNRMLILAFIKSYRDIMLVDRFPGGVIFLTVPLIDVDVNAHPAKLEVRFVEEKKIEQLIINIIFS